VATINAIIPTIGTGIGGGLVTKTNAIRFFSAMKRDPKSGQLVPDGTMYETGYLEDVHIVSMARVNALIVSAPTDTMRLIEKLIENLDTVAAARSYVNVFKLTKADATLTANLLAQLFTGQGRQATAGIGGGGGGLPGGGGALGTQTSVRPLLTISGNPSDGASLIDLRLSVDDRTNSLIVAGSLNDLDTIRAIIARLEAAPTQARYNEVIKLRNAAAADVQTAIQNFFTTSLQAYTGPGYTSVYQQLLRNVVVVAEPVSNTVLISATPEYFGEVKRIIDRIDSQPPQVMIQVLIAEVQLNNAEEFGVEVGLQSPVLFLRGITAGAPNTTTGFNFNSTQPLPNANLQNAQTVGFQGLGNLGVGRASATQGFGGFVFSASSDTFSLLVRALKAQGRVDVLSRPQLQVADNQTGFVQVGQNFPYLSNSTLTGTGAAQQSISYEPTGVTMRVTPRVNPDGKVLMRVEPQVESVTSSPVSLGNGVLAPAFNVQTVQTTVLASDGETIVLGGLIAKQDTRQENGIPYLKDIPYVGALFRYRTHQVQRREVLIIMTPHIVRSEFDHARILAEESAKMKWCLPEIANTHTHGMEVMGPASQGARPVPVGPQGPNAPTTFMPGPAYFGGYDPVPLNGVPPLPPGSLPPGYGQPGTPGVPPGTPFSVPPGGAPSGVLPPGGAPTHLPVGQPAAGQPGMAQPGTVPAPVALPAGQPGAGMPQLWPNQPNQPSGVMPVSASQPVFSVPTVAQTAFAPTATPPAAVAPTYAQPPLSAPPAYAMQQPMAAPVVYPPVMYPMAAQPLPGMPVAPGYGYGYGNRGFAMMGGTPPQPAAGKDAPPAKSKPNTTAKEGGSWTFGR
jgi:type II secretory pathway component GspD/PulD (secretin)